MFATRKQQMFYIKCKTVKDTYVNRLSGSERKRALCPYRLSLHPKGWVNKSKAEKFLSEIEFHFEEGFRLNGTPRFNIHDYYEIVER